MKEYKILKKIENEFLTIQQAADHLGMCYASIHNLMMKGNKWNKIPYAVVFGKKVIKKKELSNLLINRINDGNSPTE